MKEKQLFPFFDMAYQVCRMDASALSCQPCMPSCSSSPLRLATAWGTCSVVLQQHSPSKYAA